MFCHFFIFVSYLLNSLILWCCCVLIRVPLWFTALAVLLVFMCEFLGVSICFTAAETPHWARQPLAQGISWTLGAWRAVQVPWLQGGAAWHSPIITGHREGVWKQGWKGWKFCSMAFNTLLNLFLMNSIYTSVQMYIMLYYWTCMIYTR